MATEFEIAQDKLQAEKARRSGVKRPAASVVTTLGAARRVPASQSPAIRPGELAQGKQSRAATSRTRRTGSNAALERSNAPGRTSTDRLAGKTGSVVGGRTPTTRSVPGAEGGMSTTPKDVRQARIQGQPLARAETTLKATEAKLRADVGRGGQTTGTSLDTRMSVNIARSKREMTREQVVRKATGGSFSGKGGGRLFPTGGAGGGNKFRQFLGLR